MIRYFRYYVLQEYFSFGSFLNCALRSSIHAICTSAKCACSFLSSKIHQILEQSFQWAATIFNAFVTIIVFYLFIESLIVLQLGEFLHLASETKDLGIFFGFYVPLFALD